jgi:hypothetical protein
MGHRTGDLRTTSASEDGRCGGIKGRKNGFDTYDPMESDRNPTKNSKGLDPIEDKVRSYY